MLHSEENPKVKLHSHIRLGQRAVEKHVTVSNIEYVRDGTNMTQDSWFVGFVAKDLLLCE